MLKKAASFVLASLRDSTYRKGTPRLFARCGLADGLFEHPVGSSVIMTCVSFAEPHQDKHRFFITCFLNNENEWEFCNGYAIDGEEEADEASAQTRPLACEYE